MLDSFNMCMKGDGEVKGVGRVHDQAGVGVHVGMDGWESKGIRVGWSRHHAVTLRSHFPNSASCARPCPGGAGRKKQIMTRPPNRHRRVTKFTVQQCPVVALGQCI